MSRHDTDALTMQRRPLAGPVRGASCGLPRGADRVAIPVPRRPGRVFALLAGVVMVLIVAAEAVAQDQGPPRPQRSPNMEVLSHVPLGAPYTVSDIEVEQDLDRPYAYVSRMLVHGFDIIDLSDPFDAHVIYSWRIPNAELHAGRGAMDGKYFKHDARYYYIQSLQFGQGGPNAELGAVVFDVTSLPDTSGIREVGRFTVPETPGGFHNMFAYKHSDGRALLFATSGPGARVYDLARFLSGAADQGYIGQVPVEPVMDALSPGYHDFFIGYHPESGQDRFYGAGGGGYYIYDVTIPESPTILATVTGVDGFNWGHTVTPSPDGRYIIGEAEWQFQPLRFFDLKPALDGETVNIDKAIGAWHFDWRTVAHNHEVRWPYVFVSGYETGLQVVNMIDPENPYTVGHFDTFGGPHNKGGFGDPMGPGNFTWGVYDGAFGIDVRNVDGIVVISDMTGGFWAFRMDGFNGWNGNDWGMPNISSVQNWEDGPEKRPPGTVF